MPNLYREQSKYRLESIIAQTTAKHSPFVASGTLSRSVKVRDQYPIGRGVFPSFWSYRRARPSFFYVNFHLRCSVHFCLE